MPKPMTILISGAPGSGKSTVQSRAPYFFRARFGETAAMSVDQFYRMFDPQWTTNNRDWWTLAMANCLGLAVNLFQAGVQIVVIEGNGLYTKEAVNEVLHSLLPLSTVYHFTLDAQLEVVTARIRERGDIDMHPPDWLTTWLDHIRSFYADWTQVIDTSTLTPEETLEAIARHIANGDGRLTNLLT